MNIVFDLGGVIFTWDPEKTLSGIFDDKSIINKVMSQIFEHPDWAELDKGMLPFGDIIKRSAKRTGLPDQQIESIVLQIHENLTPIKGTLELINFLKVKGNRLYLLSNLYEQTYTYIKNKYSVFNMFDGTVISYKLNMIKPEPEIYNYLLNQFNLNPEDTVFIDDKQVNLDAASKFNIKTIKFINPDVCRTELKNLNII